MTVSRDMKVVKSKVVQQGKYARP